MHGINNIKISYMDSLHFFTNHMKLGDPSGQLQAIDHSLAVMRLQTGLLLQAFPYIHFVSI
jgi:hypothetical protein